MSVFYEVHGRDDEGILVRLIAFNNKNHAERWATSFCNRIGEEYDVPIERGDVIHYGRNVQVHTVVSHEIDIVAQVQRRGMIISQALGKLTDEEREALGLTSEHMSSLMRLMPSAENSKPVMSPVDALCEAIDGG